MTRVRELSRGGLVGLVALTACVLPGRLPDAALAGSKPVTHLSTGAILKHVASLPLRFEANRGQTDGRVRFLARVGASTIFLTERGMVIVDAMPSRPVGARAGAMGRLRSPVTTAVKGKRVVVELLFTGAHAHPVMRGEGTLPGAVNYLVGHRAQTNIPSYGRVVYRGVYPGIDLVARGGASGFEYDWVVRPGGDVSRIGLRVVGAQGVSLDRSGNLVMRTTLGGMRQTLPRIYQPMHGTRQTVGGRFRIIGDLVRVEVGNYDHRLPLVIDPDVKLLYSTYLGGSGGGVGNGIAVDGTGNAYVTGDTNSTDFPICPDNGGTHSYCATHPGSPIQSSHGGGLGDAYVSKLDPTGMKLIYSTYLGGGGNDFANAIAVNDAGEAYITGDTASHDFPICPDNGGTHSYCATHSGSPVQSSYTGSHGTMFVSKLNQAGTQLLYSTYLGGSGNDSPTGIAVDATGESYVSGYTSSTDFPICPDSGGTHAYCATHIGGPVQSSYGGGLHDVIVLELNAAGTQLLYSTYLGGSGDDYSSGIAVDVSSNAYVTGFTPSTNFPICPDNGGTHIYCAMHTGNPLQPSYGGGDDDAFVSKLNASGTQLLYSTYLGGGGLDDGTGIAIDTTGEAYITGDTVSAGFPICPDSEAMHGYCATHTGRPAQSSYGGGNLDDAYVSKLNSTGTKLIYSTYLGGSGEDFPFGIAVDAFNNAYVTGGTASTDFPVCPDNGGAHGYCATHTGSPVQSSYGGNTDAFVSKLNPMGTRLVYSTYLGGSGKDQGSGIAVDASNNAYVTGLTQSANFPICPDNGGTHSYCATHAGSPVQFSRGGVSATTNMAFVAKLGSQVVATGTVTVTGKEISCTTGTPCTRTVAVITDTDGDPCTKYTATVTSWGDSTTGPTTTTVSGTDSSGGCTVTATHTYSSSGHYDITINVTDSDGSSGQGMGGATVSDHPQDAPRRFVLAGTDPSSCPSVSRFKLALGAARSRSGALSGTGSFTDNQTGEAWDRLHVETIAWNGSGPEATAVVSGTAQRKDGGTVRVRISVKDGSTRCSGTVEVQTTTGYDSGVFRVAEALVMGS